MSALTTPDEVEQAAIDALAEHPRHLACLERQRRLPLETIERFATVDLLADDEHELALDLLPCVLLACLDLDSDPEPHQEDGLELFDHTWRLELQIAVQGGGRDLQSLRADSMLRCRWMTLTTLECLLRRLPGSPLSGEQRIGQVRPSGKVSFEGLQIDDKRHVARAEASLAVTVPSALTGAGGPLLLPGSDPDDQYGQAGPPVQVASAEATVTRDPLEQP